MSSSLDRLAIEIELFEDRSGDVANRWIAHLETQRINLSQVARQALSSDSFAAIESASNGIELLQHFIPLYQAKMQKK